jgi:hypothetical protein
MTYTSASLLPSGCSVCEHLNFVPLDMRSRRRVRSPAMARGHTPPRIVRSLFPLLVLLLLLGHVCELAAALDVAIASHAAEDHHHQPGGPSDESHFSCEAIDGLPSSGAAKVTRGLASAVLPLLATPAPIPVVTPSVAESPPLRTRPPLFLLHASLLI